MKIRIIALALLALMAGLRSCREHRSESERIPENYASVDIPAPDLSGITVSGNEVLNLYRLAADEAEAIYQEQGDYATHVNRIAECLHEIADITIKPGERRYLLALAEDVISEDFDASAKAWLDMKDSKLDLVIGPGETNDYGAYVLLKNAERTSSLTSLCRRIPDLQAYLPGSPEYLAFNPYASSDIVACDVLYYGGYPNAGYKAFTVTLPLQASAREKYGSRTILFDNIIREKFNHTVFPVGTLVLEEKDQVHLSGDAFWWEIAFREIARELGVNETVNGKGSVAGALGNTASTIEKTKSDVLGTYLCIGEVEAHRVNALIAKQDVIATFVTNTIRRCRLGLADEAGRSDLIVYNYLVEKGAISRNSSGKYAVDYGKVEAAVTSLAEEILKIQATGDRAAASSLIEKYAVENAALKADRKNLERAKIPVDIRVNYE